MKKIILTFCVSVATVILLSSCGGSNSNETSSTNNDTSSTNNDTSSTNNETSSTNQVSIGKQVWMGENLNVDKFRNGDPIPEAKTDEEWKKAGENEQPAWCYYDNDPNYINSIARFRGRGAKFGKLYNWYAVNDPRGLAPKDYHIPTDAEWTQLYDYLGADDINDEAVIGTKMISTCNNEELKKVTLYGYIVINESGFSGLPGGERGGYGGFRSSCNYGYWWSSTPCSTKYCTNCARGRMLNYSNGLADHDIEGKANGRSVRCLRD